MRCKYVFLLIFALSQQTLGLRGLARPKENEDTFTYAELELIEDLISGNDKEILSFCSLEITLRGVEFL